MSDRTGRQRRPGRPGPPQGHPCPECGALRAPDNTPSCACAERASEALRETRTAEAAAAEDFDPLRIRPYVELGGARGVAGGHAADATMPLRAVPADPAVAAVAADPPLSAHETVPLQQVGPAAEPGAPGPSRFEVREGPAWSRPDDEEPPRGRRRRTLLIAAGGAAVAVVAAAGFASGLFTYEKPARDGAAPEDVRAAVPDTSTSAASASAASRSSSPSAAASSSSPSESESPSPSASESSASPSASASAEASTAAPTARATGTIGPGNQADDGQETITAPVLRLGDKGSEVTELQLRLHQLYLYNGDTNGSFTTEVENALRNYQWSRGVEDDELGVYGAATRASLEAETKEP
ncbi:peptidoglycan-binding domain-containing protein [Streptomyces sp. NPDC001381]|uniref:peptidoglycan-binding domain-containing protein n=1 Tax=Streptomyces sp. NPDC001381 TaxID=3364567 RepID=UPI00368108B6